MSAGSTEFSVLLIVESPFIVVDKGKFFSLVVGVLGLITDLVSLNINNDIWFDSLYIFCSN